MWRERKRRPPALRRAKGGRGVRSRSPTWQSRTRHLARIEAKWRRSWFLPTTPLHAPTNSTPCSDLTAKWSRIGHFREKVKTERKIAVNHDFVTASRRTKSRWNRRRLLLKEKKKKKRTHFARDGWNKVSFLRLELSSHHDSERKKRGRECLAKEPVHQRPNERQAPVVSVSFGEEPQVLHDGGQKVLNLFASHPAQQTSCQRLQKDQKKNFYFNHCSFLNACA